MPKLTPEDNDDIPEEFSELVRVLRALAKKCDFSAGVVSLRCVSIDMPETEEELAEFKLWMTMLIPVVYPVKYFLN